MGHKVNPHAFRLAVNHKWESQWFAKKNALAAPLREDVEIRAYLRKKLKDAHIDRIEIERSRQVTTLHIKSAKPGVIIGRAGAGIEELTKELKKKFFAGRRMDLRVNVKEITQPHLCSSVVGQQIAEELVKRMPFRRSMKSAIERVMKAGAQGIKITLSGRLNGAEIARTESLAQGKIPMQNLRADIDFARVPAFTIYGAIGIKIWINRGEVFEKDRQANQPAVS